MAKTIVFYGRDSKAARAKFAEGAEADTHQIIEAQAWHGERLEGDKIEFMDDVPAGERARIEQEWGKFDNRQNMEHAGGPTSLGGVERTPGSDRRNLNPQTRVDDPAKVEPDNLKRPGFAPKADVKPEPGNVTPKPVGLDQTTGLPVEDRSKVERTPGSVAPKADVRPEPGNVAPKPVGLGQTAGQPVDQDRLKKR